MSPRDEPIILLTGATDGLGRCVARRLVERDRTLLLHGRDPGKGRDLLRELNAVNPNAELRYYNADFASLRQVRTMAERILEREAGLRVLVNNAGIGPRSPDSTRRLSENGYELCFAVNYLAGYLLSRELLPLLQASAPARIVNVASIGQQAIDFEDPMLERGYDDARAYRQSKLAQILFTFDLAAHLPPNEVSVNCLHPATLMNTRMVHDSAYFPGARSRTEDGAEALLKLILAEELEGRSGLYFDGLEQADADPQAGDAGAREKLRELSERLVADALAGSSSP